MTRQQKKAVRKALRQYGRKQKAADAAGCAAAGPDPWGRVIRQVLDYYAEADGTCAALLRLRYLEEWEAAQAAPESGVRQADLAAQNRSPLQGLE